MTHLKTSTTRASDRPRRPLLKATWKLHFGHGVFLSSCCADSDAQQQTLCGRCFRAVWNHKMSLGLADAPLEWTQGGAS